jgi:hypothetical protein
MRDVFDIAIANGLDFMALTDHDDSDDDDFTCSRCRSTGRTSQFVPAVELKYSDGGRQVRPQEHVRVQDDMTSCRPGPRDVCCLPPGVRR